MNYSWMHLRPTEEDQEWVPHISRRILPGDVGEADFGSNAILNDFRQRVVCGRHLQLAP